MAPKKKKEETYIVEKLVDMKVTKGKKTFLVKWKGYPASQNTWEPVENVEEECEDMIKALEKKLGKSDEKKKPEPKKAAEPEKKRGPGRPPGSKNKATSPRPKTANTRFMTTKPKRGNAGKRETPPPPGAPPAKKQKVEKKEEPKLEMSAALLKATADALMESVLGRKAAKKEPAKKAEKPPKEPKEAKAAGKRKNAGDDAAVLEVDSIIGMRARKSGIQYKILWKDGTQTWEPYDNVMDDDLVDEFEEAKQIEVYGGSSLAVGAEIEVKNTMEGFENSWTAAKVTKKEKGNKFTVEYTDFVDEKNQPMSESGLERKRLREAPPAADKGWMPIVGEIVEVNEDDCWWEAFVEGLPGKNKLSLKFRVSDEIKSATLGKKVRPCSWLTMEK